MPSGLNLVVCSSFWCWHTSLCRHLPTDKWPAFIIVVVQQHKGHCMVTAEWLCEQNVIRWWLKLFDSTAQSTAYHQFYPQTFHIIECSRVYIAILISVYLRSDFRFKSYQSRTNGISRHMNGRAVLTSDSMTSVLIHCSETMRQKSAVVDSSGSCVIMKDSELS